MMLDSSKFSDVGKYGTIYLMKTQNPTDPLTAFPLDEEETTFGRDQSCSIRLYYPQISPLHGKIIFEERKAFLVVLGTSGILVDGCKVAPNSAASTHSGHRTVPLTNDTEIQIHTKRFKFTYPPKDRRAALLATPTIGTPHGKRRALRLSMIQSAQVFTPRPSQDPRENLRILQSPLRPFSSPKKPSPLQAQSTYQQVDNEGEDEEIILVDGNHPRVVEDEKDLIILEDVEIPVDESQAPPIPNAPTVPPPPAPTTSIIPQTPQRRLARPSLHKAVLIRSAQRAVLKAEVEREEVEEEREVAEFATQLRPGGSEESSSGEEEEEETNSAVGSNDEQPNWKKGLQAVQKKLWPFNGDAGEDVTVEMSDLESSDVNDSSSEPSCAAPSRTYGNFMTPQVIRSAAPIGRFSVGGAGEAKRVVVEPKWKVKDIELPPSLETGDQDVRKIPDGLATPLTLRGQRLSDEERKAIQERRRSALRTPDPFFGGQTPGIRKVPGFPTSPTKVNSSISPVKSFSPMKVILEPEQEDEDEDLDTRSLLDKMKETVEEMKRRRSVAPPSLSGAPSSERKSLGLGLSPNKRAPHQGDERRFSLLAPAVHEEIFGSAEEGPEDISDEHEDEGTSDAEETDNEKLRDDIDDHNHDDNDDDKENAAHPLVLPASNTPDAHILPTGLQLPPKTPKMDGLRHIFADPKPALATPSFVGVRDLFKAHEVKTTNTPTYEGLGEMIPTPVYEESPPIPVEDDTTNSMAATESDDVHSGAGEKIIAIPRPKVKTTRISKRSTRSTNSKDTPSLADDETTPGSHDKSENNTKTSDSEEDTGIVKPNLRGPRTRKAVKEIPLAPAKPKRTRQATAAKDKPSNSSLKPESRSRAMVVKEEENSTSEPVPVKPATQRRQATMSSKSPTGGVLPSESTIPTPATRRGRKATTKTDDPSSSTVEESQSSLPKPARRTRTATIAKRNESANTEAEESTATRRKPAPRTRAKEVAKEEAEDVDFGKAESSVKRSTRATKMITTRTPSSQKCKPITSQEETDKENTPGSVDGEEEQAEEPTRLRVSRSKKAAAIKVEETVEEVPKRTRVTRTRAKA